MDDGVKRFLRSLYDTAPMQQYAHDRHECLCLSGSSSARSACRDQCLPAFRDSNSHFGHCLAASPVFRAFPDHSTPPPIRRLQPRTAPK